MRYNNYLQLLNNLGLWDNVVIFANSNTNRFFYINWQIQSIQWIYIIIIVYNNIYACLLEY